MNKMKLLLINLAFNMIKYAFVPFCQDTANTVFGLTYFNLCNFFFPMDYNVINGIK